MSTLCHSVDELKKGDFFTPLPHVWTNVSFSAIFLGDGFPYLICRNVRVNDKPLSMNREAMNKNSMDGLEISNSDKPKVVRFVRTRNKKKHCKIL